MSQLFDSIESQSDMVLDVEACLFAHILHIVSKVADQTFLTQLRCDGCFQCNDVAALLSRHKAWTSGCDHLNLFRCRLDLFALDSETQATSFVGQLTCLLRAMRRKDCEV